MVSGSTRPMERGLGAILAQIGAVMPAGQALYNMAKKKFCIKCGRAFRGPGLLCPNCLMEEYIKNLKEKKKGRKHKSSDDRE